MPDAVRHLSLEAPFIDDCYSEAPLLPRRLLFSEAPSSLDRLEEEKNLAASSRLV